MSTSAGSTPAGATSLGTLGDTRATGVGDRLDPSAPLLEVTDLNVRFPTEDGLVHAVRGVDYTLRSGEVLGIVGESGSGKSVTSLAVMGLLPASARVTGSVKYRGQELLGQKDRSMSRIRGKGVSMIFQDPMTSLDPVYKVGAQIEETLRIHDKSLSSKASEARAVELLELVGIPNARERVRSYPHEFSGGMRQRVVIAIAMANQPEVIIADEPTTALDVTVQAQILEVLQTALQETGAAMVMITHDLGVVAGIADRVLVMYAGRPVEIGGVEEIYYEPRMPYTLGLLGSLPRLDSSSRERLTPILGAPPSLVSLPPGCPFAPRCPLHVAECDDAEPPLLQVSPGHDAACIRTEQVAAAHGHAADVFAPGADDTVLTGGPSTADAATLDGDGGAGDRGTPAASQAEPNAGAAGTETGSVVSDHGGSSKGDRA
ncbi:ABC transporter ATP-binding protein [Modestobacter roseus]|uniref:Peptide/nickel transport system ATP-binding protein/peptide/nickel transport system ATP-binding protein n=1 Tax=Modestobacter roseus TaxID=1181884 RepID=A0A562ILX1_9ACTN|nr:ABC transporter ATP-binding protein [Modestobacter roseus]TWH71693.1 peptide/nickel transport system ATP-binding protein/peptide/nickel transport system ATP-binding protein [Modestobacter roseus]